MIAVFIRSTPNVEALRQAGKEVEIFGYRREWDHSQPITPENPEKLKISFSPLG